MKSKFALVFGALVMPLIVGCAGSPPGPDTTGVEDPLFSVRIQRAIDDATAQGAGADQLALLEAASSAGTLDLETERGAVRNAIDCMDARGLTSEYFEETTAAGLLIPRFKTRFDPSMSDDDNQALWDECYSTELLWVDQLYQTQPIAIQQIDEFLDAQAPVLRECLKNAGFALPPDATGRELATLAIQTDGKYEEGLACLDASGIDSF